MSRMIHAGLLGGILACRLLFGEILEINRIDEASEKLSHVSPSSLVLFDVDYTLLLPQDAIMQPCGEVLRKKYRKEILEKTPHDSAQKYTPDDLFSRVWLAQKNGLVEDKLPSVIADLQKRSIKVMGLTAAVGEKFGVIPSGADWRIEELRRCQISFAPAFPDHAVLRFPSLTTKSYVPLFQGGILFSALAPKGAVLEAFLQAIQWKPEEVVFFDDRLPYLQSVEEAMARMGIPFLGFYYRAAEQIPCHLDAVVADLQMRTLSQEGIWLSDEEAKKLLSQQIEPAQAEPVQANQMSSALKN